VAIAALAAAMTDIAKTLAELETAGYSVGDRMRLRFVFEAPTLRSAVDLANALRLGRHNRAHVRPAARRLLSSHRWNVIVITPPAPFMRSVIELWQEQLCDVSDDHAGCSMVYWEPVVTRL
jgi:hypothetical protein